MEKIDEKTKVIDILPLKKWKRILSFLADLFLNFVFTLLIFNLFIGPVGKAITGYEQKNIEYDSYVYDMNELLYKNDIVFECPDASYDLVNNINYSYDKFLSYYVVEDSPSQNEMLYHYFGEILNDNEAYIRLFLSYDENSYFEKGDTLTGIKLKDDYKIQLYAFFNPNDEPSNLGIKIRDNIKNKIYTPMFAEVFENIKKNDLTHSTIEHSYNECVSNIEKIENYHNVLLSGTAILSFLMSSIIYYLFIPILTENGKTLGMVFLRNNRINFIGLENIKGKTYILNGLIMILFSAPLLFLIPITYVSFNTLFSLEVLIIISLFSFAFDIVSLFFIIFNQYNRSWSDVATSVVLLSNDSLDEIYKSRNYNF